MKAKMRKKILDERKSVSRAGILAASETIARRLFRLSEFKRAKTVMFYVSEGGEVHTHRMIREALRSGKRVLAPAMGEGKKILLPVAIRDFDRELSPGKWGILEPDPKKNSPVSLSEIDLVVIPGVAFDLRGNRLGRGEGYYDSFLKKVFPAVPRVALAFEWQLVKKVPVAPHDIPVDRIITEKRSIRCDISIRTLPRRHKDTK